jgi:hypothetical protein
MKGLNPGRGVTCPNNPYTFCYMWVRNWPDSDLTAGHQARRVLRVKLPSSGSLGQ